MALIDPLMKPKVGPDGKPLLGITPPSDVAGKIPAVKPTGVTVASMTAPDAGISAPPPNPFMPQQSGTIFRALSSPVTGRVSIAPPVHNPISSPGPLPGGLTGEEFKTIGDAMGATNRPPEASASPELLKTIVPPMQMNPAGVIPTAVPPQPATIATNAVQPAADAATPGVGFIQSGANRLNLAGIKPTDATFAPGMDFVKTSKSLTLFPKGAPGESVRAGLGISTPNPADSSILTRAGATSSEPVAHVYPWQKPLDPAREAEFQKWKDEHVGEGVSEASARHAFLRGSVYISAPEQPLPGESQEDFIIRTTAQGDINHGTPEDKTRGIAALDSISKMNKELEAAKESARAAATLKGMEFQNKKDVADINARSSGHFETDAETGEQVWVTGRDTTRRTIGASSGDASIYKRKADALDTAKENLDAFLYDKDGMPKSEPGMFSFKSTRDAWTARKAMLEKAVQDAEAEVQAQESGGIRGRVGTSQEPTASEEPVRVSSPTDPAYLRLPAGAKYIGPDGKVAMKRAA